MPLAERSPLEDDELQELPVAVLCARCGSAECVGCELAEERAASGVQVFVPWERPAPLWSRFWDTLRAGSEGAVSFFGALPSGPLAPALRYALLAELVAVGASLLVYASAGLSLIYLAVPQEVSLMMQILPRWPAMLLEAFFTAWASFSLMLTAAHAFHGLALDAMARREGAAAATNRALRFGLYATSWDLVTSPPILLLHIARRHKRQQSAHEHAFHTPRLATDALLRGLYQLDGQRLERARNRALTLSLIATFLGVLLVSAAVLAVLFVPLFWPLISR